MALKPFLAMRAGLEATRGTNVAPTRGIDFTEGDHDEDIDFIYPEQLRQSLYAHYNADTGSEVNALNVGGNVGFNALPWWLNLHIDAQASGTGAGADKTWTFKGATTDLLKSATVQFGYSDSIGATRPAVELGYCLGETLTLKWDKTPGQSGVTFESRLLTPEGVTQISAFTGVGTYTAEAGGLVKANATAVTVDTTTIGTTTDNDFLSLEWTLQSMSPEGLLHTLNNSANAQDLFRVEPWMWTATMRRYYRNDTEWDARRAGTMRKLRLTTLGPTLGAGNYKVQLDLYGKWSARKLATSGGFGIEELTMQPVYDTTFSGDHQVIVVNDQATIT